ncbi:YjfB family protein [Paenibacillus chibensis]|uniref:YjfB family protein n=1 Tax=Paenibacillus chibensis TaxID=59846 RepID=UPI001FE4299E|nr:YjfB family protein [Paenibacillus chibensis]MEC0370711.1 YjfB family protein [Paenibacillus chibensis]
MRFPPETDIKGKGGGMMDIAALSTSMSQAALHEQVGVAVLRMAKGQAELQGQNLIQMMEKSIDPNLGKKLDISI